LAGGVYWFCQVFLGFETLALSGCEINENRIKPG
jgi:hypothetical protein